MVSKYINSVLLYIDSIKSYINSIYSQFNRFSYRILECKSGTWLFHLFRLYLGLSCFVYTFHARHLTLDSWCSYKVVAIVVLNLYVCLRTILMSEQWLSYQKRNRRSSPIMLKMRVMKVPTQVEFMVTSWATISSWLLYYPTTYKWVTQTANKSYIQD